MSKAALPAVAGFKSVMALWVRTEQDTGVLQTPDCSGPGVGPAGSFPAAGVGHHDLF